MSNHNLDAFYAFTGKDQAYYDQQPKVDYREARYFYGNARPTRFGAGRTEQELLKLITDAIGTSAGGILPTIVLSTQIRGNANNFMERCPSGKNGFAATQKDMTLAIAMFLESCGFNVYNPNSIDEGKKMVRARYTLDGICMTPEDWHARGFDREYRDKTTGQITTTPYPGIEKWKDVFINQLCYAKQQGGCMVQLHHLPNMSKGSNMQITRGDRYSDRDGNGQALETKMASIIGVPHVNYIMPMNLDKEKYLEVIQAQHHNQGNDCDWFNSSRKKDLPPRKREKVWTTKTAPNGQRYRTLEYI